MSYSEKKPALLKQRRHKRRPKRESSLIPQSKLSSSPLEKKLQRTQLSIYRLAFLSILVFGITYWVSSKSRKCPSNNELLPTNVGTLRCISDDVQGEKGWCSLRIGPWHNVCVRVRSMEDVSEDATEKVNYSMNMYTQYDLSYLFL